MKVVLRGKFIALNAHIRREICSITDNIKRIRRQASDWEEISEMKEESFLPIPWTFKV